MTQTYLQDAIAAREPKATATLSTNTYEDRLATFDTLWPIDSCETPPSTILAAAGFCQLSSSRYYDITICKECDIRISRWTSKNPLGIHVRQSAGHDEDLNMTSLFSYSDTGGGSLVAMAICRVSSNTAV